MTKPSDDVAAIAAKLTKAQREAILGAEETVDGRFLLNCFPPHRLNAHIVTMYSLKRDKLTPLGLAVRAHLQSTPDEAKR